MRSTKNRDDMAWLMREVDAGRTTIQAQADSFACHYETLRKLLRHFRKGVGRYS